MRTFCISTLGCKVNHYESEQIATLLRARGLVRVDRPADADLRIVHTCSVTVQAASKSRQAVRQAVRLPVLSPDAPGLVQEASAAPGQRVVVTGCWATSDAAEAAGLPGVAAVIGHDRNLAEELERLLTQWDVPRRPNALPQVPARQESHQRAFLKIQDGCDAHCTYCIIPSLRAQLWSKPVEEAVAEAERLVDAGHQEIVLTGIFLGAFGHQTALRRRQVGLVRKPLGELIDALCTRVIGLSRLRLSSLEPGDLDENLLQTLRSHRQVVPHFHLPLQSGSDALLRRMNRQYRRDDYLEMVDRIRAAFDRPALTTDIIVGFPGETDAEFQQTLDVVDRTGFIHIHAFSFSPRPGTAASRWTDQFVTGPVVNERINTLEHRGRDYSVAFRRQFLGQTVQLLVERPSAEERAEGGSLQHGRCDRYFSVHFHHPQSLTGRAVRVRIDEVTPRRTLGTLLSSDGTP